jgi:hypothetical protein
MNNNFGIMYFLFNLKSNNCGLMYELINSIKSVEKFHKDINIIIYVEKHPNYDKTNNIPLEIKKYVKIINFSKDYIYNYNRDKYWMGYNGEAGPMGINEFLCYINSPFEYTLAIDCDTRILNKLDYLINDCKKDLYLTYDNWWVMKDNKLINEEINNRHINGGFILFKNTDNNKKIFKNVIDKIYNKNICDQNALTETINELNVDVEYLDNRYYNFRCPNKIDLPNTDDVVICHSHGYLINNY